VRRLLFLAFALMSSLLAGQATQASDPQVVEIPSGKLHLKGFLWEPAGPRSVSGGAVQSRLWRH